jgi:hypothetical protein
MKIKLEQVQRENDSLKQIIENHNQEMETSSQLASSQFSLKIQKLNL